MSREDFEGLKEFKKEGVKLVQADRMIYAIGKILDKGYGVEMYETFFTFIYNEKLITFYPYTGWASGKGIKDGRGLNNLLKQINNIGSK